MKLWSEQCWTRLEHAVAAWASKLISSEHKILQQLIWSLHTSAVICTPGARGVWGLLNNLTVMLCWLYVIWCCGLVSILVSKKELHCSASCKLTFLCFHSYFSHPCRVATDALHEVPPEMLDSLLQDHVLFFLAAGLGAEFTKKPAWLFKDL